MRLSFKYFNPDEYYEALVNKLVTPGCTWLDVGCGRYVFPNNPKLAQTLAARCLLLAGVDPDDTIEENTFVHRRWKTTIENFHSEDSFDLITLRMVAEHIKNPDRAVESLSRLSKPGGKVVIYTINRWSPVPIATWLIPFKLHYPIKHLLWNEDDPKDTFPVSYRMNTRKQLGELFRRYGFRERMFTYVSDCRSLARFRATQFIELCCWKVVQAVGLTYPENCLLGVYENIRHERSIRSFG